MSATAPTSRSPLLRSAAFRLGALQATLFALTALVLFAVTWWAVRGYVEHQLHQAVQDEMGEVTALPASRLQAGIDRLVVQAPRGPYFYALLDIHGNHLTGDIEVPRARTGWQKLRQRRPGHDEPMPILALGQRLADGRLLVIGRDRRSEDRLDDLLQQAFLTAGAAAVLLALLGGLLAARNYLRRVEAVAGSAARIVAGDLSTRIAVSGRGDEFDRLAAALNGMLARIQQLMESMRQVSTDIAHDLRTPLAHLRQRLEAASREADSMESFRTAIDSAVADVDNVLATFAALLRIAQIETRRLRAGFSELDLSALVESLAGDYRPVFEDQQHPFSCEIAPGLHCRGDRALLTQMLANLLENALRHTPSGTPVSLRLTSSRSGPVLMLQDRGPGIPADQHQHVFQRFTRLDPARSTPGAGLGMALVAAIADSHDLDIHLSDAAPGLRVTIDFPAPQV